MRAAREAMPWTEAVRDARSPERPRFLESYLNVVRAVAQQIFSRLPASVELEDLIHDGILGLLDATEKFDPSRGTRFSTYAETRVRGAILDGLRQKDWRPRSVRRGRRELDETITQLQTTFGRPATEEEIAASMGLSLDAYRDLLLETSAGPLLSLEELPRGSDPTVTTEGLLPHGSLERRQMVEVLAEQVDLLPERERKVMELYYHEGLNMKEVGAVLGVTESRVCQLHSQAASRLRVALHSLLHATPVAAAARRR
jgi:RNA polymerase sigma factor for flagellar operon FliA